jgi:hypothetical protein
MNKNETTLDILYNQKLKYFNHKVYIVLPKLMTKIEELQKEKNENEKNNAEIDQKIESYKKKITTIHDEKNKYYLENSKYLFDYFETKQNIDKNNTPKKTINSFFNVKEEKEPNYEIMNESIKGYLRRNNFESLDITNFSYNKSICQHCNVGELIKVSHDGIIICNHWPCAVLVDSLLEWVLCLPIEGDADVAMQVNAVTVGMASKRWVDMDQDTLAAQTLGIPCRMVTLAECFPSRMPRSWSSSRNCYT